MMLQSELTLAEKLAVQKADKWTGILGHKVCGFNSEFKPVIESDSVTYAANFNGVIYIREKLEGRKRYYKVIL